MSNWNRQCMMDRAEMGKNMDKETQLKRWRLILGQEVNRQMEEMGTMPLEGEYDLMDQALEAIYGGNRQESGKGFGYGGGSGPSAPKISRWLGDVRTLFDRDIVKIIQGDAIERKGLRQLLFEPELLCDMEPDISMAATLLLLKDQIPKKSKESARVFIRKIVEDINRRLESDIQRAVCAAINRRAHSSIPSAAALDCRMTIQRNLKNYQADTKKLVPEHFYFFDRSSRTSPHTIILCIDQSGSMGESVIYSSVLSCILASLNAVKTRVVAFDTQVTDLTEQCEDPVDMLFGIQLGGGTDINKAVTYCQQYIEEPAKTIFFLISDLEEGGNRSAMLHRMQEMKESGVSVVSLLAISDQGKPYYDSYIAGKLAAMDIPCFACTPEKLPELLERALKKQGLSEDMMRNGGGPGQSRKG